VSKTQSISRNSATICRTADLELPSADTKRWSSRRKAAVVVAVRTGVISRAEACERYLLSEEELAGWEMALDKRGIPGLRSGIRHSHH
jgi:Protein of unknown function (DUF1153)